MMDDKSFKLAIAGVIGSLMGLVTKYGMKDDIIDTHIYRINVLAGKTIITRDEVKEVIRQNVGKYYVFDGYYSSDLPTTHKLILRDKVNHALRKAQKDIIEYISSKL